MQPKTVYTIGHSNHDAAAFLDLLRGQGVEAVADIRSQPFSRRYPHFRKSALVRLLAEAGIEYVFLGRELGARRDEAECYVDGVAEYDRVARLPAFRSGVERVVRGAERFRVALMCAERDPLQCHRSILVAPALRRAGLEVAHILAGGQVESHEQLEERLLEQTGTAPDLFERAPLEHAYRSKAREMAYRRNRKEEGKA